MMEIREAVQHDLLEVVDLWKELMDFHKELNPVFTRSGKGADYFLKRIEEQLKSENEGLIVAEDAGRIIGFSTIAVAESPPIFESGKYGVISDIAVARTNRRKGVGLALFDASVKWLSDRGIKRIEVHILDANSLAQGFWREMGFKPFLTGLYKEN